MPKPLAERQIPLWGRDAAIGFYGKLPARGDFVNVGLPRSFVDPWHAWIERMLAGSRAALGEEWRSAWLEAAVWRFAFPAGLCGPDSAVGLWLPSVDRVGRYFPLTFALIAPSAAFGELIRGSGGFLQIAENAGRSALEDDLAPDAVAAHLGRVMDAPLVDPEHDPLLPAADDSVWWTEGAPRVPARTLRLRELPDDAMFTAMLDAQHATAQPLEPVIRE